MNDVAQFEAQRPRLFAIAYRMLGSAVEAEDVVQDAFLRYATTEQADVRSPRAFLGTVVTRLCLDRLKAARTTREQYIGPWLPEPLLTMQPGADPEHDAERAESITMAFLVLLEALAPQERAVFLLREVFEYEYGEIAEMLALSTANCRQLFHRAKERLATGRPRFRAEPSQQQQLVERFLAATGQGDVDSLTRLLAADVTYTADGGGKVAAARQPVSGRDRVIKIMLGLARLAAEMQRNPNTVPRATVETVNGAPAIVLWVGNRLDTVFCCTLTEGVITALWALRNPDKLAYLERQLRGAADEAGAAEAQHGRKLQKSGPKL